MNLKDALKRIEELERKLRELEAQPKQEFHYHFHQPAPVYTPAYIPQPYYPSPFLPTGPTWTCGAVGVNALLSYGPEH